MAVGEEGGGEVTTMAVGEEGGGEVTTMAVGEEGGGEVTTMALGEEGCNGAGLDRGPTKLERLVELFIRELVDDRVAGRHRRPGDDAHVVGVCQRVRSLGAQPLLLDAAGSPRRCGFPSATTSTTCGSTARVCARGGLRAQRGHRGRTRPRVAPSATRPPNVPTLAGRPRACRRADPMLSRWEHNGVPVYNGLAASRA